MSDNTKHWYSDFIISTHFSIPSTPLFTVARLIIDILRPNGKGPVFIMHSSE